MITCLLLALAYGAFCILPFPFNILGMLFFASMALICFAEWLDEPPVVKNNDIEKEEALENIKALIAKMREDFKVEYGIDPLIYKGEAHVSTQL